MNGTTASVGLRRFSDRLGDALRASGSAACVGLDPVLEKLPDEVRARHHEPAEALWEFARAVLEACRAHVGVVKPQSACFERFGAPGVAILERACRLAKSLGYIVVLDAKRGDIGVTADHYAAAAVHTSADAITLNGYLGPETVEPYLKTGLGVFVLVRTSNPGGDAVQTHTLADGRTVAAMMADHVRELGAMWMGSGGMSDVGAVVGATKAQEGEALRARMPSQFFLVPGYGAQGGTAADVARLRTRDGGGVLVNASRSVIYAFANSAGGGAWHSRVAAAAKSFADELRSIG